MLGQEVKAFLPTHSSLQLTASRLILTFWNCLKIIRKYHWWRGRLSSPIDLLPMMGQWTVTEPIVIFAFIWCQTQFKIVITYCEKRGAGCWGKLIPATSESPWIWISLLQRHNSHCCYSLLDEVVGIFKRLKLDEMKIFILDRKNRFTYRHWSALFLHMCNHILGLYSNHNE